MRVIEVMRALKIFSRRRLKYWGCMHKFKDQRCFWPSRFLAIAIAISAVTVQSTALADSDYDVTINTSGLTGTGSTLAFDFIGGGGTQSNIVSISSFKTDGVLQPAASPTGSVAGALNSTLTLSNASFFNEQLQGVTLGSTISFQLDATTNAPSLGSLPDTFSFFVLDPTAANSLVTTSDPTGADSLFTLQIGNALDSVGNFISTLSIFDSSPAISVTASAASATFSAPEIDASSAMGALTLFLGALAVLRGRRIDVTAT
jgi:hypothetical protein